MGRSDLDFEISFFEGLVRRNPNFIEALIPLAEIYTKKGFHAKGLQIDKRLAKLCKDDPLIHYNLACSFALNDKKDDAFTALFKAIKLGYTDFAHLRRDSDLESLRNDPRFKKLVSLAV